MRSRELFERPARLGLGAAQLAEVTSISDPARLSRVQVRLLAHDGVAAQDAPLWARVAAPFAGAGRGAFLLPDVGDEVLVTFVDGDPRQPIVVGGLWNGAAAAPERLPGERVDRWTIVGKAGTRIAIVEEEGGSPTISLTTPAGVRAVLTDEEGGKIELCAGGATVTIDSKGVRIETGAKVEVQASSLKVSAGTVSVDSAMSTFSGVVQCDTLIATTVVGSTYTTGAGNIW